MFNISVEKAIKKGWLIRWAMAIFWLFPFSVMIYVGVYDLNPWLVLIAFVSTIFAIIIFHQFAFQYWRNWAFKNVDNIHELKRIAIQDKLPPSKGEIMNLFKLKSLSKEWDEIQYRFESSEIISEDIAIPSYVELKSERVNTIVSTFLWGYLLILIIFFVLLLIDGDGLVNVYSVAIIAFSILVLITESKNLKFLIKNDLVLKIDTTGIVDLDNRFFEWNKIVSEKIEPNYINEQRIHSLTFIYEGKKIEINLNLLKINRFEMMNIIKTFRIRFNKKATNESYIA